jgi:hypothetical protein
VLAGDADGDGIADSNLIKLPVGEIDGITYYYCYRVVDNSSKVNVNTAWSSGYDFDFTAAAMKNVDALGNTPTGTLAQNLGWFRSHVGLYEMLRFNSAPPITAANWVALGGPTSEIRTLNQYRFGWSALGAGAGAPTFGASSTWVNESGAPPQRGDGSFITQGDVLEHQLARRITNTGSVMLGAQIGRAQAFSIADSAALAYHGGLLNPEASRSPLEQLFFGITPTTFVDSLYRSAPNYAPALAAPQNGSIPGSASYAPSKIAEWYDELYNWDAVSTSLANGGSLTKTTAYYRTLRPVLTSWNPVSDQIPIRYESYQSATVPTGMPLYGKSTDPTNHHPTPAKTNINMADFPELWRAYWCVMAENTEGGTGTPFATDYDITTDGAYTGNRFATINDLTSDPIIEEHTQRMFRSPLRDPRNAGAPGNKGATQTFILNKDVVKLRAAIAASNAMALRDTPRGSVPAVAAPRDIKLDVTVDGTASPGANVHIFPLAPQPFITEVFAQTDIDNLGPGTEPKNTAGYVAVELYNPYPFDIPLNTLNA